MQGWHEDYGTLQPNASCSCLSLSLWLPACSVASTCRFAGLIIIIDAGHACGLRAQIHWFSIINSCVTVLLLTGFLATILMRVLKNDFIKYTRDDEAGARIPQCGLQPGQATL